MNKKTFAVMVSALSLIMSAFVAQAYTVEKELQELQNGEVKLDGTWCRMSIQKVISNDYTNPTVLEEVKEPVKPSKKVLKNKHKDFRFYNIPEEYKSAGAELQKEHQKYLWKLCEKRELNYYILLAMIERESGYKSSCIGDNGESIGYLQIQQKWHSNIMKKLGVTNLQDPKGNLNVGTKLLQNIYKEYGDSGDHCVLMVYNMGATGAKRLWKKGVYSTKYSRQIIERSKQLKQEIKQETTQDNKG